MKIAGSYITKYLLIAVVILFSTMTLADPPSRVARISVADDSVSILPGGTTEWVDATLNRPLITGDKLWTDANSRAELQVGGAAIRASAYTDLSIFNIDNNTAQFALNQGM